MSALYFLPLTMPSRVGVCLSWKLRVTSYTAVTVRKEKRTLRGRTKNLNACVCVFTPPVPLRHCSVVVNPLVLGSRWYLSIGRPLLCATSILIWCFFSVKRVPSQYRRNCGGRRPVLLNQEQKRKRWPLFSCIRTFTLQIRWISTANIKSLFYFSGILLVLY